MEINGSPTPLTWCPDCQIYTCALLDHERKFHSSDSAPTERRTPAFPRP